MNSSNGFTNYSTRNVGGTVFCPFYQDQKFKYQLVSNGPGNDHSGTPDPGVFLIAYFVGYF